jgi:hypothetical protein
MDRDIDRTGQHVLLQFFYQLFVVCVSWCWCDLYLWFDCGDGNFVVELTLWKWEWEWEGLLWICYTNMMSTFVEVEAAVV